MVTIKGWELGRICRLYERQEEVGAKRRDLNVERVCPFRQELVRLTTILIQLECLRVNRDIRSIFLILWNTLID